MTRVDVVEVGPRDGLQNEVRQLSVQQRLDFIRDLHRSGIGRIEVGAFVSPKWVPQMQGSDELIEKIYRDKALLAKPHRFSALVPNLAGLERALKTPIEEVAVFGASSEAFSKHNINCTIQESLQRFSEIVRRAKQSQRRVRGYLSVAFGCPYEGQVSEKRVVKLVERYLDLGVSELSIGDTIGVATPKQVRSLLKKLTRSVPARRLAMHFHDTRGLALANVLASLDFGIRVFDSSFGGLGGCPYAKGASGNLATEDLVYMLEGMGIKTGVQLEALVQLNPKIAAQIGKTELPSKVGRAGLFPRGL